MRLIWFHLWFPLWVVFDLLLGLPGLLLLAVFEPLECQRVGDHTRRHIARLYRQGCRRART